MLASAHMTSISKRRRAIDVRWRKRIDQRRLRVAYSVYWLRVALVSGQEQQRVCRRGEDPGEAKAVPCFQALHVPECEAGHQNEDHPNASYEVERYEDMDCRLVVVCQ
jgi:hypothetical protein